MKDTRRIGFTESAKHGSQRSGKHGELWVCPLLTVVAVSVVFLWVS